MSKTTSIIKKFLMYFLLLILAFIVSLPLLNALFTSLKPQGEILSSTKFLPSRISFFYYKSVFKNTPYTRFILNSFLVSVTATFISTAVAALAGYAIARFGKKLKLLKAYGYFLIVSQMFPWVLMLIPLFIIFGKYGLINNYLSLIIAYTSTNLAFSTWLLRGFFSGIPIELEEAGMIDGCSRMGTLLRIILPLSSPGIATAAIFAFLNCWNEYLLSSIFLSNESVRTLPVALQSFIQQYRVDWGSLMAASIVTVIPALFFLIFMQKYIVNGLTAGAVKG